jgi:hypothetical protein
MQVFVFRVPYLRYLQATLYTTTYQRYSTYSIVYNLSRYGGVKSGVVIYVTWPIHPDLDR